MLDNPHDSNLAPSTLPRRVQQAGVVIFVFGVIAAAGFLLTEHWRRATFTLGATMIYVALLRLTCDSRVMGLLSVRSRRFDATFTGILGAVMVFLASSVDALGS